MARVSAYRYVDVANDRLENRAMLSTRLENAREQLKSAFTNWDSFSPAQKDTAIRAMLRVVAALVRLELDETETGGV